jgi:hypothetical protein
MRAFLFLFRGESLATSSIDCFKLEGASLFIAPFAGVAGIVLFFYSLSFSFSFPVVSSFAFGLLSSSYFSR